MDAHLYEQQQLENLKAFWHAYGKRLFIGGLFALVVYFAWDTWQTSQKNHLAHASNIYGQLINYEILSQPADASVQAKVLIDKFSKTPYAAFASLYLAKQAVLQDELEEARNHLQWVVTHFKNDPFPQIAQLRLARLELAEGNAESALSTLKTMDPDGYLILTAVLQSEAQLKSGDRDSAIQTLQNAYSKAAEVNQQELQPYIRSKLNDLGVAISS
jgi:predicted negative regulator of RcsB-dependent stress response